MKKLLISTLGVGAIFLSAGQADAGILFSIDNFNDGLTDNTLAGPAPKSFTQSVSAPGILGGTRNVNHNLTVGTDGSRRSLLFINGEADTFSLSNGTSTNSTAGTSYGPGLNTPLVATGFFEFDIVFYDSPTPPGGQQVPVIMNVTVNGVTDNFPIPLNPTPFDFQIPLSAFGPQATLDSFAFSLSGPIGYDIEIDAVGFAIPEPMTILGTGLALAALPTLKRAHQKKA